jgi:hypothetical protein
LRSVPGQIKDTSIMSFYVTAISATEITRTDKAHLIYFQDIETIANERLIKLLFFLRMSGTSISKQFYLIWFRTQSWITISFNVLKKERLL